MFREKNVFRLNLEKLILVNDFALLLGTFGLISVPERHAFQNWIGDLRYQGCALNVAYLCLSICLATTLHLLYRVYTLIVMWM